MDKDKKKYTQKELNQIIKNDPLFERAYKAYREAPNGYVNISYIIQLIKDWEEMQSLFPRKKKKKRDKNEWWGWKYREDD